MSAVYYIGKRTLFDILRTGLFWVAIALCGFICFAMLYWGWKSVEREQSIGKSPHAGMMNGDPTDPDNQITFESGGNEWDPMSQIKPESIILYYIYGVMIGFANLLSIFVMLGLVGREIDRKTIDLLLARPVSRTQIYLGKLFAGWASSILFMAILTGWALICMVWGGMGAQTGYIGATAIGTLAPILIGTITLVLTIWMRGFLAGLLATIITFASGTSGMFMIKLLGVQVLKLNWAVYAIYKILPPLNVIGQKATDYIQVDSWMRFASDMFEGMGPKAADGLYTEMWQLFAYFGVILILGWLSFFRRQFT